MTTPDTLKALLKDMDAYRSRLEQGAMDSLVSTESAAVATSLAGQVRVWIHQLEALLASEPTPPALAAAEGPPQGKAEPQDGLLHPAHQVFFRAGLLACREYMARFVEAESPTIARSIRANWWPSLGADFGPPRKLDFAEATIGEFGMPEFRVRTADEISPTQEALPIALGFLDQPFTQPQPERPERTPLEVDRAVESVTDARGYTLPTYVAVIRCSDGGVQLEGHTGKQDWELKLDALGNIEEFDQQPKESPGTPPASEPSADLLQPVTVLDDDLRERLKDDVFRDKLVNVAWDAGRAALVTAKDR
jgi:hypothetical protein